MIATELTKGGMVVAVSPEALHPNTGYWRTDWRADVMPWHGWICLKVGMEWTRLAVGSWATMTDLLHGFTWQCHNGEIELYAMLERPHPESSKVHR